MQTSARPDERFRTIVARVSAKRAPGTGERHAAPKVPGCGLRPYPGYSLFLVHLTRYESTLRVTVLLAAEKWLINRGAVDCLPIGKQGVCFLLCNVRWWHGLKFSVAVTNYFYSL